MAVNITGLKVQQDTKTIREIINSPQGQIEVYEPTMEDMQNIVDLQRGEGYVTGTVSFDGRDVIRQLFPMLTNIDLGDLSDEELEDIIHNPSIHLLMTQQVVAQIVFESNKLYAERIKTELMNSESTMSQVELMNSIPALIMEQAKGDGKVADLVNKVEEAGKELEEAMKEEEKSEVAEGIEKESNE